MSSIIKSSWCWSDSWNLPVLGRLRERLGSARTGVWSVWGTSADWTISPDFPTLLLCIRSGCWLSWSGRLVEGSLRTWCCCLSGLAFCVFFWVQCTGCTAGRIRCGVLRWRYFPNCGLLWTFAFGAALKSSGYRCSLKQTCQNRPSLKSWFRGFLPFCFHCCRVMRSYV